MRSNELKDIVQEAETTTVNSDSVHDRPIEDTYDLSPTQLGMLIHSSDRHSGTYLQQMLCSLTDDLNLPALETALHEIVSRHAVLRTSFHLDASPPFQRVHPRVDLEFINEDWRAMNSQSQETALSEYLAADRQRGFEPAVAPLFHVALFRMAQASYEMVLTYHHSLLDGRSQRLVIQELFSLYDAYCEGTNLPQDPPRPYCEYINWLKDYDLCAAEAFWRQELGGLGAPTIVDLGFARETKDGTYATIETFLSETVTNSIRQAARNNGLTLNTLIQGSWSLLLNRYTGEEDVVFGAPRACRRSTIAGADSMVGVFINTLPVRVRVSSEELVLSWLQSVRASQFAVRPYEHTPLAKIQEWSEIPRGTNLFESIVVFESYQITEALGSLGGKWIHRKFKLLQQSNYPLMLLVYDGTELLLKLQYDKSRFDHSHGERMLGHVTTLLRSLVDSAELRIGDLSLLTATERQQLLAQCQGVRTETPPDKCIHQFFEQHAERTPNATAVIFEDQELSYGDLNSRANQLAHYLRNLGVGQETLVGICVERSLEMVIALLGILKAGGAYVPLDPAFPRNRLAFMIEDADLPVLLTQESLVADLPSHRAMTVVLEAESALICRQSKENFVDELSTDNLAYVIYTSGSTGTPKGVAISHRALTNCVSSMQQEPGLTPHDVLLAVTTLSFDIAGLEIYLPLITGACLVIADAEVASDGIQLKQKITDSAITVMQATPATWQMLINAGWQGKTGLKILCGGEALSRELATELVARGVELWNMYGPTETTIWSTQLRVEAGHKIISIGRPVSNTQIYLLDKRQDLVPIGVVGELHIGGDGLARGYLNRPELTAEKFIPNAFSDEPDSRLYKTGDLARYLPDGNIEYLRRIDDQVKLRGFRIELGEIKSALSQHPTVAQAVVLIREDRPADKRLVAYIVARDGSSPSVPELRKHLQTSLPEYMVPANFVFLYGMPLTPNNKIDRGALPAPEYSSSEQAPGLVGPRTLLEEILVNIWVEVLARKEVGINDNFFEIGGHSLLATQVLSRIRDVLQVELPFRAFFEAPTIVRLAEKLEPLKRTQTGLRAPAIAVVNKSADLPLSFAQQRLWFLNQLLPLSPFYNFSNAFRVEGPLDVAALETALAEIVKRHESLRTIFVSEKGAPFQRIVEFTAPLLKSEDLSGDPEKEREAKARLLVTAEVKRPFDLTRGRLLRAHLLKLSAGDHILILTMHHIAADGWSIGILFRELSALYAAFAQGMNSPLPPLPIQYADYSSWQREWLKGEVLERLVSYWKNQLVGAPVTLALPTRKSRPNGRSYNGSRHLLSLPEDLAERLKALSRQEGVTLFMTLLAAFQTLLARYANQEDIVVGTDVANRTQVETEGLIGFFVNLVPLRVDLSGDPSFRELLRRVREVALGAYEHQEMPFEKLVEELQPERTVSHNPLVQVLFVFQNTPIEELKLSGLSVSPLDVDTESSKFDMALFVREAEGQLLTTWVYNTDLFEAKHVAGMARQYETLLTNFLAQPEARLSSIEMHSETEKAERNAEKSERQESRLRNLMGVRRQAVNLSQTRGIRTEYLPGKSLPLVFQPDMDDIDLVDWTRSNRDFIDRELLKHGALLFRGFDLASATEFEKFAEAICPNLFGEYGDLPREGAGGKVYGSTPYPADEAILFHNESSHMHRWPMRIWFFCVQAAEQGGETPIVDCRRIYELLDPRLRDRFTEKKLMYVRNYTDGLDVSWQTFFGTTDRSVVEDYCRKNSIDFFWIDGHLRTRQLCPAVVKHPQTNEMVFFNQLQLHHVSCLTPAVRESLLSMVAEEDLPRNVYYGDGSPIEDSVIQEILGLYQQVAVSFPWQKDDILMLNNMLTAHGRNPYAGARKILVAMGEMVNKDELDPTGPVS